MTAMSKAVILQHVAHEGPGRIVPVLRDYGIPTEVRHLYQGDEVPTDLDELRVLVVATYRPTELLLGPHPFYRVKLELQGRGVCTELSLGFLARQDIARFFNCKVYLDLRVKVRHDWRDDERVLDSLGLPRRER